MDKEIYEFEIARNAEGGILATAGIKGADTSYRIAGPKAWGGSSTIAKIDISQRDLVEFVLCYAPGAYAEIVAYDSPAAAPQVVADERAALADQDQVPYLIYFDDADRKPEMIIGGTRAQYRFKQISGSWNAHLFAKIASNSQDDKYPCAALAAAPVQAQHSDDAAVDRFATAMKEKLAVSRAKGRGGWDDPAQCTVEKLAAMLCQHVGKGDPVDIANFAMMIHQRGGSAIDVYEALAVFLNSRSIVAPVQAQEPVASEIDKAWNKAIEAESISSQLRRENEVLLSALKNIIRNPSQCVSIADQAIHFND